MARHGRRRDARSVIVASLVVAFLCAFFGFLVVTNDRVNGGAAVSSGTEDLLSERTKHVAQLQSDISGLSAQIDSLKKYVGTGADSSSSTQSPDSKSTVLPALTGPGITVTLSDSPRWQDLQNSTGAHDANINDYVVHQQDLEAVVNAMWAGGAEAMMIQDQRVLPSTAVRCVGNVLLLQGKQYAPPYKVSAIGPIDSMQKSLDSSASIKIYKQYVDSIGLGWESKTSNNLSFPKSTAFLQTLKYASEG